MNGRSTGSARAGAVAIAARACVESMESRRLLAVAPITLEFQVSDNLASGSQTSPSVAHAANGSFIVT